MLVHTRRVKKSPPLQNDKLDIEDRQEIPSSFPDVAIAYKLLSEAGKLINLYDWMQVRLAICV